MTDAIESPAPPQNASNGWDLTRLRERFPRNARPDIDASLASLGRCSDLLAFHVHGARNAIRDVISDGEVDNLRFVLGVSPRQAEYAAAKIASEAHMIAAANMVRSFADIFALLVKRLVVSTPFNATACYFATLEKDLPPSALRDAIDLANKHPSFVYVADFSNAAKHRQLVPHGFHVSFDEKPDGVRFSAFTGKHVSHPSKTADEAIACVVDIAKSVVTCGIKLNRQVLGGEIASEV